MRLLLILLLTLTSATARQPNVVIFLTDDQGTLDAHCFGATDLQTPAIDQLAETGVRFTQAYAHMVCCPARAALLTGRYPQRGGVNDWTQSNLHSKAGTNMALEEVTLAEALKEAGYRTAIFGKWHLGAAPGFGPTRQGFDEFFGNRGGFIDNFNHFFLHQTGFHDLYEGEDEQFRPDEFYPELIVNRSLEFIEENQEAPFFLYLPFNTPHYPEQPPAEYLAMYEGMEEPRRTYAAFVTMTDAYIGKVLAKLEELDLRKDTIVLFLSDNGHSTEDNAIRVDNHKSGLPKGHNYGANGGGGYTGKWIGHKATFFEGGVRVPAVLSYPAKVPQGIVRDQAVMMMDWFPTILELSETRRSGDLLDGVSLLPIIESADAKSGHDVLHFQWINSWSARRGDWKLICHQGRGANSQPRYTLHNLADAEPEVSDHAATHPEVVERLKALHETWQAEVMPVDTGKN